MTCNACQLNVVQDKDGLCPICDNQLTAPNVSDTPLTDKVEKRRNHAQVTFWTSMVHPSDCRELERRLNACVEALEASITELHDWLDCIGPDEKTYAVILDNQKAIAAARKDL